MRLILFGASGMIGQGVLRECLLDAGVERVLAVVRSPLVQKDPKLEVVVVKDPADIAGYQAQLSGYGACFFCLGVSSAGMSEVDYRRVTYDLTLAAAAALAKLSPNMTFIYISGQGTDSSEKGRAMWARVKGATENALLQLPFNAYLFRIGAVLPLHGIKSRTGWYNALYVVGTPLFFALRKLFPKYVLTTEQVGRAMLAVARSGAPKRILESPDIFQLVAPAKS